MANDLQRLLVAQRKGKNRLAGCLVGGSRVPIQMRSLEWSSSNAERRSNVCGTRLGLRQSTNTPLPRTYLEHAENS